jgi:hypothetical protein
MSQRLESSRPEALISQDSGYNSFSWVSVIPSCSPVCAFLPWCNRFEQRGYGSFRISSDGFESAESTEPRLLWLCAGISIPIPVGYEIPAFGRMPLF